MRTPLLAALLPLLLAAPAVTQDFLLYKFEGTCTNEIINYAPLGLPNGILQAGAGPGYAGGINGGGLAAGTISPLQRNVVQTGWSPVVDPITNHLTIAFWARQDQPLGTGISYLFGMDNSGFRLFTSGIAGRGLILRSVVTGGPDPDLTLPATVFDFQTAAGTTGAHVAITVDAAADVATWYVNGNAVHTSTGFTSASVTDQGTLLLGGYQGSLANVYMLDDVLFSRRLYTAAEVAELCQGGRAGTGSYTSGVVSQCNPANITLDTVGGRPVLGNQTHALRINTSAPGLWLLIYGETRCSLGGAVPLPLDVGMFLPQFAGCSLVTETTILLSGVSAGPAAPTLIPMPISATLQPGAWAFCQAAVIPLATNQVAMSKGLALSVGY